MRRISLLTLLLATLLFGSEALLAQTSYKSLPNGATGKAGTSGAGGVIGRALGPNLNSFDSQAAFDAATPGAALVTEGFENSNLPDGAVCTAGFTLDSTTDDACFSAGSVIPGFALEAPLRYVVLTRGFFGVPDDCVGPVSFVDDATFTFNPAVSAVNFNLISAIGDDDYEMELLQ